MKQWFDSIDEWRWLYSPSQELLFHRHNISWVIYQRLATTRRTKRSRSTFVRLPPHCWTAPIPSDVLRATTKCLPATDQVLLTGVGASASVLATSPPSILNLWRELSAKATPYLGWVPDEIRIFGSEKALFDALMNGELCVISDGSYLAPLGTSATTLTTRHGTDRIGILTQTPGRTADQCSYRSELCGMYVGIMVADWLVIIWGQSVRLPHLRPTVYFGSDGLSALRRAFGNYHIKATDHHFDLLSAVRSYRRKISFQCRFRHIQAHRDKEVAWENLTWWEQMNCEVDLLAGEYRESLLLAGINSSPNSRFFTELSVLWPFIGGIKQSKLERGIIQELVALPTLRSRWGKLHWDENVETEVAWPQVGTAMRSLRSNKECCWHVWGGEIYEKMGILYGFTVSIVLISGGDGRTCPSLHRQKSGSGMAKPDGVVGPLVCLLSDLPVDCFFPLPDPFSDSVALGGTTSCGRPTIPRGLGLPTSYWLSGLVGRKVVPSLDPSSSGVLPTDWKPSVPKHLGIPVVQSAPFDWPLHVDTSQLDLPFG